MEQFRRSCIFPGEYDAKYMTSTAILEAKVGLLKGFDQVSISALAPIYIVFNFPSIGSVYNDKPGVYRTAFSSTASTQNIQSMVSSGTSFATVYGMVADSPGFNNASFVYS